MSLVHVVPGLKVTNPIGFINLSPPPAGLPAGLVRLHLVRNSIDFTRINRVNGQPTALAEMLLDGPVSYAATHGLSTRRRSGWADPTAAWNYNTGFTMMAVARPHEFAETPVNAPVVGTYIYSSGQRRGSLLRLQPGFVRFQTFETTPDTVNANYTPPEPMAPEPTMVFGGVNGSTEKYFVCVPHLNAYRETPANIQALAANPNNGLSFGSANVSAGSSEANAVQDLREYLIGLWDVPLSQAEMLAVREIFKPWLADLSVGIV